MPADKKWYVYIAGPITRGDQFVNVRNAILAAERLRVAGAVPFVPHLFAQWHTLVPVPYEEIMVWDFAWLDKCDALVRLPGESSGADREVARAFELGIPVFGHEATELGFGDAIDCAIRNGRSLGRLSPVRP